MGRGVGILDAEPSGVLDIRAGGAMTPYSHEPSYFAAMLYISGKPSGFIMRDEFTPEGETGYFAYADSALDRVHDVAAYVAQLAALVEDGGYLLLSSNPLRADAVERACAAQRGMYLVERSVVDGRVFTAHIVARREVPSQDARKAGVPEAIVFRNGGGIGDVIHAAAVAEEYSRQGFDTLLMSMEKVRHVFAANPWIKRWVAIPGFEDQMLFRFMEFWAKRVRLFVNLDWSIEGFLLKKQHASEYFWSDAQRRAMCGKGYARNISDLAGLPTQYKITSYAGEAEVKEAKSVVDKMHKDAGFMEWESAGEAIIHAEGLLDRV